MFILPLVLFNLTDVPVCYDGTGRVLPVNNSQIVEWKHSTPNLYLNRGHILGSIGNIYPDKNGHKHFQVVFNNDTIEFVYNSEFGTLHELVTNTTIEGCGDYITSNVDTNKYPASPDGAILHWVHKSNNTKHQSGFIKINENIYGQMN